MRGLVVASLVVAMSGMTPAALAKRPARLDPFDPIDRVDPPDPCGRGRTWNAVAKCLGKHGDVSIVYETDGLKVVLVTNKPPAVRSGQLALYSQDTKEWRRGGLSTFVNQANELVGVTSMPTPNGTGVRLEVGTMTRSFISTGTSSTRGVLRRVFSTACSPGSWTCRSVMTSCDAYVRGRLFWTFRGELVWHPTLGLRVRGDVSQAGGSCIPVKSMLLTEETPP